MVKTTMNKHYGAYLGVQRRRLEAELVNVGEERSVQILAGRRDIQTALPLLFCHNLCIAWRSCRGGAKPNVSILAKKGSFKICILTLRSNLPSGLSGKPMPSQLMLHWLLTLEVREPKGWSGMVPMTRGRFRDRLIAPGMSTYT